MQEKIVTVNVKLFEEYLKNNNLSKSKFCRLCGISLSSYNKILQGKTNISIITLLKVVLFMNVKFNDIYL